MTFLAIDVQSKFMIIEKSQKEFQSMIYTNKKSTLTNTLQAISAANVDNDDYDMEDDPYVISLRLAEEELDTAIASLDAELKLLNEQIKSFEKARDTNIKNDGKLKFV